MFFLPSRSSPSSPEPEKKTSPDPRPTSSPPNLAYNGAFGSEEEAVRSLLKGLTEEDFQVGLGRGGGL